MHATRSFRRIVVGLCGVAAVVGLSSVASAAPADRGVATDAAPADLLGAYRAAVQTLRGLGIEPFLYPTAAPFCAGGTPLGLAPAVAGTAQGPWPGVSVLGQDLNAVK